MTKFKSSNSDSSLWHTTLGI